MKEKNAEMTRHYKINNFFTTCLVRRELLDLLASRGILEQVGNSYCWALNCFHLPLVVSSHADSFSFICPGFEIQWTWREFCVDTLCVHMCISTLVLSLILPLIIFGTWSSHGTRKIKQKQGKTTNRVVRLFSQRMNFQFQLYNLHDESIKCSENGHLNHLQ